MVSAKTDFPWTEQTQEAPTQQLLSRVSSSLSPPTIRIQVGNQLGTRIRGRETDEAVMFVTYPVATELWQNIRCVLTNTNRSSFLQEAY